MRTKKPQLVITFSNTPEAIKMEKYCQEHQLPGRLIPIPSRDYSQDAGWPGRQSQMRRSRWVEQLKQGGLSWEQMQVVEL